MLSTKLINLKSNIFVLTNYSAISPIISSTAFSIILPALVVSILFIPVAFDKYKNQVLIILAVAINSYITTVTIFNIRIYK